MIKRWWKAHRLLFSAVLAVNQFRIFFGDARLPLATCHWVCTLSKLYTLIKSNQFVSELVSGLNFRWIAFALQF